MKFIKKISFILIVVATIGVLALLASHFAPKEQGQYAVNLTAYSSLSSNQQHISTEHSVAVLSAPSPKDERLDEEIRKKIEGLFRTKGYQVTKVSDADYVILPFYWAQESGNVWCADGMYSFQNWKTFKQCEMLHKIGAHPYLWSLTLKIYEQRFYVEAGGLQSWWLRRDPIWTIEAVSKIRVSDYTIVLDYILKAIQVHFNWQPLTYQNFFFQKRSEMDSLPAQT